MIKEEIGECSLYLGDCRDIIPTLDKAKLVITDPPYRTISGGTVSENVAGWSVSVLSKNDGKIFDHNDITPEEIIQCIYNAMADNADAYIMTNNLNLLKFMTYADSIGLKFHNFLQWKKNTCSANRWYMIETEHVLYYYKGKARSINNKNSKQIFFAANPRNKEHPTEKPVSLMSHYIDNSTDIGDIVLDPFMGSGTSGVACVDLNRKFIGIEQDVKYFDIACRRIKEQYKIMKNDNLFGDDV